VTAEAERKRAKPREANNRLDSSDGTGEIQSSIDTEQHRQNMSDTFDKHRKPQRWVILVPLVVVLAVLLLEYESPGLRVTPSLLTIALAIFALFLSAQAVFRWALILFVPVVLTLIFVPNNGVYETPAFVALRSAAYLTVAWIAVVLSRYRSDAEQRLHGLLCLFDSLKSPIVVSDADGNLTFANRACCDLIGRSAAEIKDTNFYSAFMQSEQRGRAIENYLQLFHRPVDESFVMTIRMPGETPSEERKATCSILRWDHRRLLVTQLD
jgi:PAS domain S-box-containing protein